MGVHSSVVNVALNANMYVKVMPSDKFLSYCDCCVRVTISDLLAMPLP